MKIAPVPYIKYTLFMYNDENSDKSNQQVFEKEVKHAPSGPYTMWSSDTIPSDPNTRVIRTYYSVKDVYQH